MSEKPNRFVLDTSALLAMIEAEEGGKRVYDVLSRETTYIPFVSLLELRYITLREKGQAEADQRYVLLKNTKAEILWELNEPILLTAARLKASYRISLGDSIVAAFAAQTNAVLLHKDPEYEALKSEIALEALPYKR